MFNNYFIFDDEVFLLKNVISPKIRMTILCKISKSTINLKY